MVDTRNARQQTVRDSAHCIRQDFRRSARGNHYAHHRSGASLTGEGIAGDEARLAETLAGPIQTLMRIDAGPDAYLELLRKVSPTGDGHDLAARVHERVRQLRGPLEGNAHGGEMALEWPE